MSLVIVIAFAVTDDEPTGDPDRARAALFTWFGNIGALGVIVLMAAAGLSVIVFFLRPRRGAAAAQAWRLVTSALAGLALLVIAVYTVKDFGRRRTDSFLQPGAARRHRPCSRRRPRPGRRPALRRPQAHARIGLGNEAFQLEKAAEGAQGAS